MTKSLMNIFFLSIYSLAIVGNGGVLGKYESGYKWFMPRDFGMTNRDYFHDLESISEIKASGLCPQSPNSIHLRVGEYLKEKIGCSSHRAGCERLTGDDVYIDEYQPKFRVYQDDLNGLDGDLLSYFTFIDKQVWNCTSLPPSSLKTVAQKMGATLKSAEPINFYRIVSVLHGISSINRIYYFEGIKVMADACPIDHIKICSCWAATFREVKYLDPSNNKPLRYDGKIYLNDATREGQSSIFQPVHVDEEQTFVQHSIEENLKYLEKGQTKTATIDSQGETIRIGKEDYKVVEANGVVASCKMVSVNMNGALSTDEYLPHCSILASEGGKEKKFVETYKGKKINIGYFSVVRQEKWDCTYNTDKHFMRRVTELVAALPVKKVEYYTGINVWKYRLNSKSYSVKIREIYYYEKGNNHEMIKFGGTVKLEKPKHVKVVENSQSLGYTTYLFRNTTMEYDFPILKYSRELACDDDDDFDELEMGAAIL